MESIKENLNVVGSFFLFLFLFLFFVFVFVLIGR